MQNFNSSTCQYRQRHIKHNSYIVKRNRSICDLFRSLYNTNMPTMRIYAELADKFDLAEFTVRQIIAHKSNWL